MEAIVWIKVAAKRRYTGGTWLCGAVSASKTKPNTDDNEVAIRVAIDIPDAVFDEPVYEVNVKLPIVTRQLPESTQVAKELGKALSDRMGFRVNVSLPVDEVKQ